MKTLILSFIAIVMSSPVLALEVQKISDTVYALVGEKQQRSETNLANNATFGVVITDEGVVLVDPGGSWKGAAQIDSEIKKLTKQPVKFVINTGGQDHRWLGNDYWQQKGAKVIASSAAVEDHKDRETDQLIALGQFLGPKFEGTKPAYADIEFETNYSFTLGGTTFDITHVGQAHTPGDSFVHIAKQDIIFSGDIIYVERILGVGGQSNAKSWIDVFEALAAKKPKTIVPGHGHVTDLKQATAQTYDYLVNLRTRLTTYIDGGGEIMNSVGIDQSAFKHLEQFEQLARKNAQQTFEAMEWE